MGQYRELLRASVPAGSCPLTVTSDKLTLISLAALMAFPAVLIAILLPKPALAQPGDVARPEIAQLEEELASTTGHKRGDADEAIARLEEAVEITRQLDPSSRRLDLFAELSEAYASEGRYAEALKVAQEYEELNRELYDRESSETLALMRVRFETEQQQQEIELLSQKQKAADLKLARQTDIRRAMMLGFALFLTLLLMLVHRSQLISRVALAQEMVAQERAANERLREVDRLRDAFLANTSHELRTPLYGITGLAESLIDGAAGELPEVTRDHLVMLAASGRRLSSLVNDVLDFSKLEHHSLALHLVPVKLHTLTDVVLTLLRPMVANEAVELHNRIGVDLPPVLGDENRLHQILHYLVGNVTQCTTSEFVEVAAAVVSDRVEVRVMAPGADISTADQERIFTDFEQGDGLSEDHFGGNGLGLAVTRQLVEMHGGELTVESTSGKGSTFTFTLEIAEPVLSEAPPLKTLVAAPHSPGTPRNGSETNGSAWAAPGQPTVASIARILLVDDEPVNLQILSNFLARQGFDLTLALSGDEALRLMEEQPFDLVLLDIMMPKVSGYQVCRTLRAKYPLHELPIIFLTAKVHDPDVVDGMALGANDYLTKPISKESLLARVRPHLELLQANRHLKQLAAEKMAASNASNSAAPDQTAAESIARILLVDDEPVNLQVLSNFLARQGFDLTLALSGDEALRLMEEGSFDLVLLDIMMPKISGYQVCRTLRAKYPLHELPIIFLTAKDHDPDVAAAMALGANDYFTKPISKERLLARVRPHLELLQVHRRLKRLAAEKLAEANAADRAASDPTTAASSAHILLVDDEPVNLQVLSNFLARQGFDLTLALSGDEALRLVEERSFDLVLLDIMMPKVSGYQVCRTLRAKYSLHELPIIFLTAKDRDSDVVAGMALGANDYLTKPISKDRLLARVQPHLELLQVHRQLEQLVAEKMAKVKVLSGLLPICCGCKKIRDDEGYWAELEEFIDDHSEAKFSHSICPDCAKSFYGDSLKRITQRSAAGKIHDALGGEW